VTFFGTEGKTHRQKIGREIWTNDTVHT